MTKENLKTYLDVDNGENKADPDDILNLKEFRDLIVPPIIDYEKTVAKFRRRVVDCPCCAVAGCAGYNCASCIFSQQNSLDRLAYINELEAALKEKEKETMKENKTIKEFLRPGVLFKTEIGYWYMYICNTYSYQIVLVDGHPAMQSTVAVKSSSIVEAYYAPTLFTYIIKDIIDGKCNTHNSNISVWKRPDPVKEMTMADLEKHFGCVVKIVKENK